MTAFYCLLPGRVEWFEVRLVDKAENVRNLTVKEFMCVLSIRHENVTVKHKKHKILGCGLSIRSINPDILPLRKNIAACR